MNPMEQPRIIVQRKSRGLAFLLAFLFGPLGMLYTTVGGALIMLVIALVVSLATAGLGLILVWPICIIWSVLAA
jgi:hypothetical protein